MPDNRILIKFFRFALVLFLTARVCADEVTWLAGVSSPTAWSIRPTEPNDAGMIHFRGPTPVYVNRCAAEEAFGGRPVLRINVNTHQIQLAFERPGAEKCATVSPICGLEGSFGQLPPGAWVFFCTHSGAAFSILFTVVAETSRSVYYVDSRAYGSQSGTSWTDAFVRLQDALAAVRGVCEIRVAKGVYLPDQGQSVKRGDPAATFELRKDVLLRGGYAGVGAPNPNQRDILAYETVLSGDLANNDDLSITGNSLVDHRTRLDNCLHVVTATGVDSVTVLDGFTIRGGHAFGAASPDKPSFGGGIYIDTASPVFRNCLIERNAAGYYGGGIYSRGNCTPMFVECVIADNRSFWRGGGLYKDWGSRIHLERCLLSGNATTYDGGAVASHTEGDVTLSNCILSGNLATEGTSGRGGAIYSFLSEFHLNHCTLVGNSAMRGAGVACASAGEPGRSYVEIRNSILWDRGPSLWVNDGSILDVAYSDVQGGWPGLGNLDADPNFVEPGYWDDERAAGEPTVGVWFDGDYRLTRESPCVDSGDPRETPEAAEKDFAGRPRRSGVAVDMGAYELTNDPPLADAGTDVVGFSLDGVVGNVTLDASRSLDAEGGPLTYRWYLDGRLASESMRFTIELPVGEYDFVLIVNDGIHDSEMDTVHAGISPIIPTTALVSPRELERDRTDQPVVVLAALPTGYGTADFDMAQLMLLFPGGVKATTQALIPWLNGRIYALAKFDRERLMAAVPTNGMVELRVVGALKNGRFFSGADTVRIR